jgi:uncharacterized membrane protein YdjX (TVP38/TMEM64 family)
LILTILVCVIAALYLVSRQHLSWEALIEGDAGFRSWLSDHPLAGFCAGFVAYLGMSLVPGLLGKSIVVGWFYGFWQGLVLVNLGLTVTALLSFLVSRYIFRDLNASRLGPRLARANAALERQGGSYLFAARVLHAPFTVTNYLMGATRIHLYSFWWATQLGLLPGNIVFVYAGSQAPTLEELAEQGVMSLLSPGLIAAFVALSVLPLASRYLVRRVLARVRHRR